MFISHSHHIYTYKYGFESSAEAKYIVIKQDHKDILEVDTKYGELPSTRYYPLLIANLKETQKNRIQTFGEAKMTSFILALSFSRISIAFIQVAFCLK